MERPFKQLRCYAPALAALLGMVAIAPTNAAEPQPPADATATTPEVPEITITAPRPPTPEELKGDSVSKFMLAHARPAQATGQFARWRTPVCPQAQGLTSESDAYIAARITAVAATAGIPYGAAGCKANIHIYFTNDPQKLIDGVAKELPGLLGFHYVSTLKSLATVRHPVAAWYATATQGIHGEVALDAPVTPDSSFGAPGTAQRWLGSARPGGAVGTRISTGLKSLLVHVLVLVDARKLIGYDLATLSDYVAMLVLSETRTQDACGQLPSVLDMLAPECDRQRPTQITAGDLAFLRALYKAPLDTPYYVEMGSINGEMEKQLVPH